MSPPKSTCYPLYAQHVTLYLWVRKLLMNMISITVVTLGVISILTNEGHCACNKHQRTIIIQYFNTILASAYIQI